MPDDTTVAKVRLRKRIAWLLQAGTVLLVVLIVSVALQLLLDATGDASGASAVRGILYVAAAGLGITVLLLVTCLSYAVIRLLSDESE